MGRCCIEGQSLGCPPSPTSVSNLGPIPSPTPTRSDLMDAFNMSFLIIFTAELFIKLVVLTPNGYFADG